MAILGKFIKQPDEVESYSIQFFSALSPTDELESGYVSVLPERTLLQKVVRPDEYEITSGDEGTLNQVKDIQKIVIGDDYPVDTPLYISNIDNDTTVTVLNSANLSYSLLPRTAVVITKDTNEFNVIVSARAIVVNQPGDQRIRALVSGGLNGTNYKIEATVSTQEGRVLQDEFVVKIKDI